MQKLSLKNKLIAFAIIIIGVFILQFNYIYQFPLSDHSWAQNDRYALSLGFVDNGLNFLHPETNIYNHQFPNWWSTDSKTVETAVEFPIHDYVPAVFMKLFNTDSFLIFRCYILLFGTLGLFYLFKLGFLLTNSNFLALFATFFAMYSPLFAFYHSALLPTIPALSLCIVGFYFYFRSKEDCIKSSTQFGLSLFFLTLAALSRTTFIIPLIAVIGFYLLVSIHNRTIARRKIIAITISVLVYLVFLIYKTIKFSSLDSDFLSHLMYPTSIAEALNLISISLKKYSLVYFSLIQYVLMIFLVCIAVLVKKIKNIALNSDLTLLTIYFFGCFLFCIAMLKQFPNHEYYVLDSFFLPLILLLILSLKRLSNYQFKFSKFLPAALVLTVAPMYLAANSFLLHQKNKGNKKEAALTYYSYKDSHQFLDSLNVKSSAKILALDLSSPNMALNLMRRKGYILMRNKEEDIKNAMTFNYDYVIYQNRTFKEDIFDNYPNIINEIEIISTNGRITLCKRSNDKQEANNSFFNVKPQITEIVKLYDYNQKTESKNWSNNNDTIKIGDSVVGFLNDTTDYGLTFKSSSIEEIKENYSSALISIDVKTDVNNEQECLLVVAMSENNEIIYYRTENITEPKDGRGTWKNICYQFDFPKSNSRNVELAAYLWNSGKAKLQYNNFQIAIFKDF